MRRCAFPLGWGKRCWPTNSQRGSVVSVLRKDLESTNLYAPCTTASIQLTLQPAKVRPPHRISHRVQWDDVLCIPLQKSMIARSIRALRPINLALVVSFQPRHPIAARHRAQILPPFHPGDPG